MTYVKQTWADGEAGGTPITAARLGHIEDGIEDVEADATTALALKAPLASPTFTGTVSGVTKTMVGLGNVDNTADTAKPVSTAQAAADTAIGTAAATDATTKANAAQAAAIAASQPVDADLTAIAALSTTAYGRAFLALADQAALMGLVPAASETVVGKVELATQAEVNTGTDTTRAVVPLTLQTRLAAYAQPLDSDLTAIAALTTTSYGRAFLALADAAAGRSALGLGTAAVVNTGTASGDLPLLSTGGLLPIARVASGTPDGTKFVRDDGVLATPAGGGGGWTAVDASETVKGIAELATQAETNTGTDDLRIVTPLKFQTRLAAYAQPLDSDLTSIAALTTTSYGRAFLELANQAALMGLVPDASETVVGKIELATQAEVNTGTDTTRAVVPLTLQTRLAAYAQPLDSDLTAIAALTTTSYGRAFLALADAAAARTALSLGTAATVNTGTASGDIPLLGASGVLAIGRLATGTPDGTKFVRDDGTLAVPSGGGGGSLTTVTSTLTVDVACAATATTDILSITLTTGTWLINVTASVSPNATGSNTEGRVVLGTAVGTLAGGQAAIFRPPATGLAYPIPISCLATVTTGGTLKVQITTGASAAIAREASLGGANTAGATGIVAVKVA